ncbi:MAG: hypothetical protein NXI25_17925 [bacterium]|nr:hypothetical protein [bacterium]
MKLHDYFLQRDLPFKLIGRKATNTSGQLAKIPVEPLFFAILLLFSPGFLPQLSAQQSSGLELHLMVGQSDAVWIERDYSMPILESGVVNSGASPTFEFQLRHALPLSEHWQWVNGLAFGVDSYKLNPYVDKDFNRYGSENSDYFINAGIYHFVLLTAMRYDRSFNEKHGFWVQLGLQAAYFVRGYVDIELAAYIGHGQAEELFHSELIINDANEIAFAPEIQLAYRRTLGQSRWKLFLGTSVVVSRFESAQGTFQIFGDNEVRSGTLEKRWLKAGLNLGAQYALAKP